MTSTPLLGRQLLFVTGKGGVGKTTIAAALAELAAGRGLRTLVCEMDAKGALAGAFDVAPLRFEPREIRPNLFAMAMNTEDSLKEYLRLFVRVPLMGRIGPLARTFDSLQEAGGFVATLQKRQGLLVASPDEIAFRSGWISADQLRATAEPMGKNSYGQALLRLADGGSSR